MGYALLLLALLVLAFMVWMIFKAVEPLHKQLKVVRFGNGKYGLQKPGYLTQYYDKNLTPWSTESPIEQWCQFDTIEEVEALKKRLLQVNDIKEV